MSNVNHQELEKPDTVAPIDAYGKAFLEEIEPGVYATSWGGTGFYETIGCLTPFVAWCYEHNYFPRWVPIYREWMKEAFEYGRAYERDQHK